MVLEEKLVLKMASMAAILDLQSEMYKIDFQGSSFRSRSRPVVIEQISAQIDQRFGKRYRKLIFKTAILDF